jgi:putative flippase GtrA
MVCTVPAHVSSAVMKHIGSLLERKPGLLRFLRYSATSVLASGVSFVTIALVFRVFGASSVVATTAAFCAGALVAFVVNRVWSWQLRETNQMGRQFARYWVVAIGTYLVALACTTVADRFAREAGLDKLMRTLILICAYFGSYAVTFVVKYVLLDRFVFKSSTPTPRSRPQVENTTRA